MDGGALTKTPGYCLMKYRVTLTFTHRVTVEAEDHGDAINQAIHMGGTPKLTDSKAIPDRYAVARRKKAIGRWAEMAAMRKRNMKLWQIAEHFHVTVRTVPRKLEKLEAARIAALPKTLNLVPAAILNRSSARTKRDGALTALA